jgi:hypothetical protein
LSAVLLSSAFAAAPATAQYRDYNRGYGYDQNYGRGIEQQLGQLSQRIDNMYQRRLVSANEARRLQREVQNIQRRLYTHSRNGLSQREHQDIEYRVHNLRERLRQERYEGRRERRDDRRW